MRILTKRGKKKNKYRFSVLFQILISPVKENTFSKPHFFFLFLIVCYVCCVLYNLGPETLASGSQGMKKGQKYGHMYHEVVIRWDSLTTNLANWNNVFIRYSLEEGLASLFGRSLQVNSVSMCIPLEEEATIASH